MAADWHLARPHQPDQRLLKRPTDRLLGRQPHLGTSACRGLPQMRQRWLLAHRRPCVDHSRRSADARISVALAASASSLLTNLAFGLVIWIAWVAMAADWHLAAHTSQTSGFSNNRPIVCLGDSLTSGLPPVGGYPQMLQEMVSAPVIDRGQAGITTDEALRMVPEIVRLRPQVVVVELGGHDFLKGHSRAATRKNLVEIVSACQKAGAAVVLFEIPRGFIVDPFAGLEREIARQYDLQLIPDTAIRQLVLFSPHCPPGLWLPSSSHLSDDGLHPNAQGNQLLARVVADCLADLFGKRLSDVAPLPR